MESIKAERTFSDSRLGEINHLKHNIIDKHKDKYSKQKTTCQKCFPKLVISILGIIVIILFVLVIKKIIINIREKSIGIPPIITPGITPNHDYRIIAINYASTRFIKAQSWNTQSALEVGEVDGVINYSPDYIDKAFKEKNKKILGQYRGNGYWIWKPYFIHKTLKEVLNDGDYLIYTDSGTVYLNSTEYLIKIMKKRNLDIFAFSLEGSGKFKEKYYTKRDAFVLMKCDEAKYSETFQYTNSFVIYKKSKFTLDFVEQELKYSQDSRIVTDMVNTLGYPNYDGFIDHRHTQSIFSLLCKKYEIPGFRNPNQFGGYKYLSKEEAEKEDDFPIMFYTHKRNVEHWDDIYDQKIQDYLYKLNKYKEEKINK